MRLSGGTNRLPVATQLALANTAGAQLDLNGNNQTVETFSGGGVLGGNIALGSGTLTMKSTQIHDTDGAINSFIYGGAISGGGGLTLDSTLTFPVDISPLILTGTNLFTGLTHVIRGGFAVGNGGTTGSLAGDVQVEAGWGITFNYGTGANVTYPGQITGGGSLAKAGAGTLTLSGASSHSGGTALNGGILKLVDGAVLPGPITAAAGTTLLLSPTGALTFAGGLGGAGAMKVASGSVTLAGTNGFTGGLTVDAATTVATADAALGGAGGTMTLRLGGALRLGAAFTAARSIAVPLGGGVVDTNGFDGGISGGLSGTSTLTKNGAGTFTIAGKSNSSVAVTAGVLRLAAGSDSAVAASVAAGATLEVAAGGYKVSSVDGTGQVLIRPGVTLSVYAATPVTIAATLSGSGALSVASGTVSLTGSNSHGANDVIADPGEGGTTLAISTDNALGAPSAGIRLTPVASIPTTLRFDADLTLGASRVVTSEADQLCFLDTNGHAVTLAGKITGASLGKIGAGTLTFTGTDELSGEFSVAAGTLIFNGSATGNALNAGASTIARNGATLGGTGTLGAVNVQSGGTLAPGSGGAGTLAVSGTLTLGGGSLLNLELAGTTSSDKIALTGGFTASGTTTVNITGLAGFGAGTYPLITGAGGIGAGNFTLGSKPGGHLYALVASGGTLSLVVDGIEAWRLAHFGSTQNTGSAADAADPDGDGWSNLQEFISGTGPNDRASVLKISQMQVVGNDCLVSFPTLIGKTYRLERSGTLQSGSWQTVQDNIPGTAGSVQITDPGGALLTVRFYRLAVW